MRALNGTDVRRSTIHFRFKKRTLVIVENRAARNIIWLSYQRFDRKDFIEWISGARRSQPLRSEGGKIKIGRRDFSQEKHEFGFNLISVLSDWEVFFCENLKSENSKSEFLSVSAVKLLNTYWTKPSPLSMNSMLLWSILLFTSEANYFR